MRDKIYPMYWYINYENDYFEIPVVPDSYLV